MAPKQKKTVRPKATASVKITRASKKANQAETEGNHDDEDFVEDVIAGMDTKGEKQLAKPKASASVKRTRASKKAVAADHPDSSKSDEDFQVDDHPEMAQTSKKTAQPKTRAAAKKPQAERKPKAAEHATVDLEGDDTVDADAAPKRKAAHPKGRAAVKKPRATKKSNAVNHVEGNNSDEDFEVDHNEDVDSDPDDMDATVTEEREEAVDPWVTKEDHEAMQDEINQALEAELDPESLVPSYVAVKREPPASLVMPLLPYQKEFLAWAIEQELGPIKGGVLADEMGMGKTIQAVSIIVTHPEEGCILGPDPSEPAPEISTPTPPPSLKLRLPSAPVTVANGSSSPATAASTDCTKTDVAGPSVAPSAPEALVSSPAKCDATKEPLQGKSTLIGDASGEGGKKGSEDREKEVSDTETAVASEEADAGVTVKKGRKKAAVKVKRVRVDPMKVAYEQSKECRIDSGETPGEFCKATLVVCPVVAAFQWRSEIARYTAPGTLHVLLYHGPNRATQYTREQLEAADVVLTTYSVIEVDYRKNVMAPKATCTYCNRKFNPQRLSVHLRYFCGPYAQKTEGQAKQDKKGKGWGKGKGASKTTEDDSKTVADDDDEPPEKKRKTGLTSKAASSKAKPRAKASTSKKPVSKANPKPKKGAKSKKQSHDEDGATSEDWAPDDVESDDTESEGDDDLSNEESEDEEEAGPSKGNKRSRSKSQKMESEEIDRKVTEEAMKMISKAQAIRDKQEQSVSILHEIKWRRIILDEAHNCKDRSCNTARSAFALQARYRWGLSGTPLQNRVTELYSLVRFLRIYPYSHYFADKTKCCSLDFPFTQDVRKCDLCDGGRMSHYCWWNRRVANPIKYHGYEGRGRTAMLILKNQILPRILLRRTKIQCADDLALPPRRRILRKDAFDEREADFYEALYTQSQATFSNYIQSGTVLNNYAHIFDLLIRLRQAVNHPYLVVYSASGGRDDNTVDDTLGTSPLGVCGICHDPLEDGIMATCSHTFCRVCVHEYLGTTIGVCKCPVCARPLTIDLDAPSKTITATPAHGDGSGSTSVGGRMKIKKKSLLSRVNVDAFQSSTKVEALRQEIEGVLRYDASAKCIVFSQFTSMLDIIHFRLQQVGIRCVKLEGSMSIDVRNKMIQAFNYDPDVTVFLMSLKAGGVALNLTVASHVMLMDPWWNPAVEQQAQDRIHRLGQFKPITVTRFVIRGTIEERILKLQEKKQLVFEGTVGKDAEALGKLTVDDLRFLFG